MHRLRFRDHRLNLDELDRRLEHQLMGIHLGANHRLDLGHLDDLHRLGVDFLDLHRLGDLHLPGVDLDLRLLVLHLGVVAFRRGFPPHEVGDHWCDPYLNQMFRMDCYQDEGFYPFLNLKFRKDCYQVEVPLVEVALSLGLMLVEWMVYLELLAR
jgi:hypothetical protein